ncbi:hypothetical protein HMPREF9154_2820 [Arachnia propionica F0230a]|nr:hypothetical protein HMPREF9154_2820 [Arachnia propionica F0230a]
MWCSVHQLSFPSLGCLVDLEAVGQVVGRELRRVQETTQFERLRVCAGFVLRPGRRATKGSQSHSR